MVRLFGSKFVDKLGTRFESWLIDFAHSIVQISFFPENFTVFAAFLNDLVEVDAYFVLKFRFGVVAEAVVSV